MRIKHLASALTAATVVMISTGALAAPIAVGSQLNINGFNRAIPENAISLDQATGLDFTAGSAASSGFPGVLGAVNGSGSFADIMCQSNCGKIKDILNFSAFTPIANFYFATGGVSFDLNSLSAPFRFAEQNSGNNVSLATLLLSGRGILHRAGFDDTPGIVTLTTQGEKITTFSASTVAQAIPAMETVPEPGSLALLGLGLVGFIASRKKSDI